MYGQSIQRCGVHVCVHATSLPHPCLLCQAWRMPRLIDQALPLQDCTVLSLRPRRQHASLRAAAARLGARVLAISPIAITAQDDAQTRGALATALKADVVLFTSPNAARTAITLASPGMRRQQRWIAVGAGTRRALVRAGIDAIAPARMDSEGLLALPALAQVQGKRIGLITGQGGRGVLQPALEARGAQVIRVDVYARSTVSIPEHRWRLLAAVLQTPQRIGLALTSAEALHALLAQIPASLLPGLQGMHVLAASERLAITARDAGFNKVVIASSPQPRALMMAMLTTMSA